VWAGPLDTVASQLQLLSSKCGCLSWVAQSRPPWLFNSRSRPGDPANYQLSLDGALTEDRRVIWFPVAISCCFYSSGRYLMNPFQTSCSRRHTPCSTLASPHDAVIYFVCTYLWITPTLARPLRIGRCRPQNRHGRFNAAHAGFISSLLGCPSPPGSRTLPGRTAAGTKGGRVAGSPKRWVSSCSRQLVSPEPQRISS
jgi:hypothetical protein